jgi:hypothetical protein
LIGAYAAMGVLALAAWREKGVLVAWLAAPITFPLLMFKSVMGGFRQILTPAGCALFASICAAAFLAVMFWQVRYYKGKALRVGECAVCGCDLRATPDRCPECGAVPAKKEPLPS